MDLQAQARAHRLGQTRAVMIYRCRARMPPPALSVHCSRHDAVLVAVQPLFLQSQQPAKVCDGCNIFQCSCLLQRHASAALSEHLGSKTGGRIMSFHVS